MRFSTYNNELLIGNEEKSTHVTIKNQNAQEVVPSTILSDCSNIYNPIYEMHQHNGLNQIIPAIYSEYPYSLKRSSIQNELVKDREFPVDTVTNDQKFQSSSAHYQELSIGKGSCGILSNYLPIDIDLDTVAWGTISTSGGRLCLPQSGINLTIPRGAIHQIHSEEMFLSVCRDQTIIPTIDALEMLLSPIILCGPPNVRLVKPIILTIPHCSNYPNTDWNIRILSAFYLNNQIPPLWKELSIIRPINISDTMTYVQLDPSSAHIMTSQPQMICIIGKKSPITNCFVSIRLKFMAFSEIINQEPNHLIRIHIIPDTKEASENVISSELKSKGQLLDNCKKMTFSSSGNDITMCLEELSSGWRCHGKFHVISHTSIWGLNHTKSYQVLFPLEHVDPTKVGFTCNISIKQVNESKNNINIHIHKENTKNYIYSIPTSIESFIMKNDISQTYLDPLQTVFRLSFAAREQMWPLLDQNWKILANHMNLNGNLKYFEGRISPSDTLLDLWEARCREEGAIFELIRSLRAVGRNDCAIIVEQEIIK